MKHRKQSRTISLVYMLLKYYVLPSDFGYAAKLYHGRKLMYSINVFQKKEDEVKVNFSYLQRLLIKTLQTSWTSKGKRFYM